MKHSGKYLNDNLLPYILPIITWLHGSSVVPDHLKLVHVLILGIKLIQWNKVPW